MFCCLQNLFFSLVDGIDGGYTGSLPDLPSFLPGVNRSAFLASQEQLDNLVGGKGSPSRLSCLVVQ